MKHQFFIYIYIIYIPILYLKIAVREKLRVNMPIGRSAIRLVAPLLPNSGNNVHEFQI